MCVLKVLVSTYHLAHNSIFLVCTPIVGLCDVCAVAMSGESHSWRAAVPDESSGILRSSGWLGESP